MEAVTRDEVVKSAFQLREALLGHAYALLRDWTLAEDALQDAFLVVMNRWSDFRPGTSLFHWVRQIVRYKAQEHLRARSRSPSRLEGLLLSRVADVLEQHVDEDTARRHTVLRRALQACLALLNPRALRLVSGFYLSAASCEELARAESRSVNAVRLSLSRLRKQLHACMLRRLPALEAQG